MSEEVKETTANTTTKKPWYQRKAFWLALAALVTGAGDLASGDSNIVATLEAIWPAIKAAYLAVAP